MSMLTKIRAALLRRWHQEDGAVTVDWVVLTALAITMCLALATLMNDAYSTGGRAISNAINAP
jgi:hypothetical protein